MEIRPITHALEEWMRDGFCEIGEIAILQNDGAFTLVHREDLAVSESLENFASPEDALEISRYDATGNYRPLKSAPNLRRGWKLAVSGIAELQRALDYFYPAAIGLWRSYLLGNVKATNFRETANRQSGMYAAVKKIANDEVPALVKRFCDSNGKCLKTMLWNVDESTPLRSLPASKRDPQFNQVGGDAKAIPLLCCEACNLFVAEARIILKAMKT